jgi:putative DNA methylase
MLENHAREGLPAADLQVIKRGKALEYFSRHYGKVFKSDGEVISVKEALVGINQILDEDATGTKDPPPINAEPITRQFMRIFDGQTAVPRDHMQKFLRGSGMAPDDFGHRGWCAERNKVFIHVDPVEFARDWQGRHRRKLTADLDQALVLVGACVDGSGVNAADTLRNENFKAHPALKDLLTWYAKRGANQATRNAASRALTIYNNWAATHRAEVQQMSLFFDEEEAA